LTRARAPGSPRDPADDLAAGDRLDSAAVPPDPTQPLDRAAKALVRLLPQRHRAFALRRIRLAIYRGDAVECPCCGGRFKRFMPGLSHRATRVCPRCGAQERHRALWLYMRERTDLFSKELSILHWAPEYALQRSLSELPRAAYVSADLGGDEAQQHMDMTDVPFKDDAFDLIVCVHVLEHVPDDRRAMREMVRVLKPGGVAMLLVPIVLEQPTLEDPAIVTPEQRKAAYWQEDHVRLYGADFPQRLEEEGFDVTVDRWVRTLDGPALERYGLFPLEDVYVARKAGA
jgi:SAM-dependent methyltransferase